MDPKQFLARFKSLASSLTAAQIATLGVVFVAVVVLLGGSALFLRSSSSSYRLLFSDMDAESAADVVSRLESLDVPYALEEGGRGVRVPADRVDALRLQFSSQGLPASGRIGFEIFDRTAFGATEFLEHVNYRRALEGEIARTIATLSEVAGARVHISMAKESLFGDREQPAKASVVLALKNRNRPLSVATVTGIGRLVAASVEGLRPEAVVIVDNYGRPLAGRQEDGDLAGDGVQGERQQQIEQDMARRVVSLLEPVVGADRVRANVTVRLNTQSQEETEERWDPSSVIRSRQVTAEGAPAGAGGAMGIAGARSNLPVPPAVNQAGPALTPASPVAAGTAAAAAASIPNPTPPARPEAPPSAIPPSLLAAAARSAETTNFEVGKTVRHTVRPRGDIARLSVAVLIDHEIAVRQETDGRTTRSAKPRSAADIQKIQGIVAAAVGLDPARGDQLTVENFPFDGADEPMPAPPSLIERHGTELMEAARVLAVLLLGLGALLFVVRPLVRRTFGMAGVTPLPQLPQNLPRTVGDLQGELGGQLDSGGTLAPPVPTMLGKNIAALAQGDPERAARLIRGWLTEEEAK